MKQRKHIPKHRGLSALINLSLVLVSVVLTLAFIELGSWIWVSHVRPQHLTQWEFRATQPPPYQGADYFGSAFLAEAEASVSGRISTIAELRDFSGRYFNVENGFRVTTDVPPNPQRRVLMFGGSTLFGQEVPDRHTIASYLQRMLNESGVRWEVRNFGLPGMNAAQQTLILQRVALRAGDIVVYYHGVNDVYYLVFGGYQKGWERGVPAFRPVQKLSAVHKWMHAWHKRLKDYSYTAQVALDIYQRGMPDTVTDAAEMRQVLAHTEEVFRAAVADAAEIAAAADASFVHFLQPTAYTAASLSPYERETLKNPLVTAPGVDIAFREGYPRLRAVAAELAADGIAFYDISDALDGRAEGDEVYLDFCHINHEGNRLVARRLMDAYFDQLLSQ